MAGFPPECFFATKTMETKLESLFTTNTYVRKGNWEQYQEPLAKILAFEIYTTHISLTHFLKFTLKDENIRLSYRWLKFQSFKYDCKMLLNKSAIGSIEPQKLKW